MSDEQIAQLTDAAFDAGGDLHLEFKTPNGTVKLLIPKWNALDGLMPILHGFAEASERPGPMYRAMIAAAGLGGEIVQRESLPAVPCLLVRLTDKARLRISVPPKELLATIDGLRRILESYEHHARKTPR